VPGLARTLEEAGLTTILVTPMPFWAERVGVPRALAVEFPFGQVLGPAGDAARQHRVIEAALELLETAAAPGTLVHSAETWPYSEEEARKVWQPPQPSPIVAEMAPQLLEVLRQRRRGSQ
jgi:hypothetical protein